MCVDIEPICASPKSGLPRQITLHLAQGLILPGVSGSVQALWIRARPHAAIHTPTPSATGLSPITPSFSNFYSAIFKPLNPDSLLGFLIENLCFKALKKRLENTGAQARGTLFAPSNDAFNTFLGPHGLNADPGDDTSPYALIKTLIQPDKAFLCPLLNRILEYHLLVQNVPAKLFPANEIDSESYATELT